MHVLDSNGKIIGSVFTEGGEPANYGHDSVTLQFSELLHHAQYSGHFSVSLSFPGLVQNAQYFITVTACVDVVCRESKTKQFCECPFSMPCIITSSHCS